MTKKTSLALTFPLLILPCVADLFPNGDFENAGISWEEVSGSGTYGFSYPDMDGHPNGFGVIDHSAADGGFGIWVGNDGQPLTLDSLGLAAETTYDFTVDMKLLSGSNIGGFKLDFTNEGAGAGSTGDLRTSLIGGGSTWETYTFRIAIPAGVNGFKVVPLWGVDSSVGYDNIGFSSAPVAQAPIPNNDFASGDFGWSQIGSTETSWSYPETGGNPGEYGVMANTGVGFGIWVANSNNVIPLSSLELEAGTTVNFLQDMILISGKTIGGLKIDFFTGAEAAGSTGDIFGILLGDGSAWESYTFPINLPEGIDGIKIVPLWGAGSSVGYDNFRVQIPAVLPPASAADFEPRFTQGTLVSWPPTNEKKLYQPQASADGSTWTDLGPAFPGTTTTTILDPDSAPFHRVIEKDPASDSAIVNGDFETSASDNPTCAESWKCFSTSGQFPTLITDAFSGTSSIRLAVQNDAGGSPNQAEIQQNLAEVGGFVTGGESYTFSFRAKQVSSGVSYVQQYRLQWLDASNLAINGADVGFNSFSGGNGTWRKIAASNLVAPANATGVFIQIFGATGAVSGTDAKGEVFIDSINLSIGGQSEPTVIETTEGPGVGVFMLTETGKQYKAQVSDGLQNYSDLSGIFTGNGTAAGAGTAFDQTRRYYRFLPIEEEVN